MSRSSFSWPAGRAAALSFSFDDGRPSQLDHAVPLFNQAGIRATFYALPKPIEEDPERWRKAAEAGHEIGNHTVTHPCSGNFDWSRHNALEDYTLERMAGELDEASRRIQAVLGSRPETFAYPCCQTFVGRSANQQSYVPLIAERFIAGRGGLSETDNEPAFCDLSQLAALNSDEKDSDNLIQAIGSAIESCRWIILVSHDVRPEAGFQMMTTGVLERLCRWCVDHPTLWVAPVKDVAAWIAEARTNQR